MCVLNVSCCNRKLNVPNSDFVSSNTSIQAIQNILEMLLIVAGVFCTSGSVNKRWNGTKINFTLLLHIKMSWKWEKCFYTLSEFCTSVWQKASVSYRIVHFTTWRCWQMLACLRYCCCKSFEIFQHELRHIRVFWFCFRKKKIINLWWQHV